MRRAHSRYSNGKCGPIRQVQFAPLILVLAWPAIGDSLACEPEVDRALITESTSAIQQAEVAIREAQHIGNLWLGTRDLLARASALQSSGDNTGAMALAHDAENQARLAINQYRLERARYIYRKLKLDQDHDPDQLLAIDGFIRAYDGAAALRLAQRSMGD